LDLFDEWITTPSEPGPYELHIDLLLESSAQINYESASRLAKRLSELRASW
jgi:hypothetical protein